MPIRVVVPKELTPKEARVALVPDSVSRLLKLGFEVVVETGAGRGAHFSDEQYQNAGARLAPASSLYQDADIILKVQPPLDEEIDRFPSGSILIGFIHPYRNIERLRRLSQKKLTCFAMESIPRITRAQSMDALSSQATVNGYKAALLAANLTTRFFPMLTTAAGTIRPSKVLVLGAGVAGLQAIATAQRLGAVVEAYDVRPAAKEEVESVGAKFLSTGVSAESTGGYARELTAEEKTKEQEMVAEHIRQADVVITTAHVPGRPAPKLIPEEMVDGMKPGSVIIDVSVDSGGNCSLTRPGEMVERNGVKIVGIEHLTSELSTHASEMYSKNLFYFVNHLSQGGKTLDFDRKDEILSEALLLDQGEVCHESTRSLLSSHPPSPPGGDGRLPAGGAAGGEGGS